MVTITNAAVGLAALPKLEGAAPLPDGLYQPSGDHLGHALMSAEQFHPIVPDCPTDYIRPRPGAFKPQFFSEPEFAVVHRFVALLLGEMDTPSATVQEVAEWIDLRVGSANGVRHAALQMNPLYRALAVAYMGEARVKETEATDPATICREGLVPLKTFLDLGPEQQLALVDEISDQRPDLQVKNAGTRFFDLVKAESIRGLYTSRMGLKELDYKGNAFYARSPGCDATRKQQL